MWTPCRIHMGFVTRQISASLCFCGNTRVGNQHPLQLWPSEWCEGVWSDLCLERAIQPHPPSHHPRKGRLSQRQSLYGPKSKMTGSARGSGLSLFLLAARCCRTWHGHRKCNSAAALCQEMERTEGLPEVVPAPSSLQPGSPLEDR